MVDLNEVYFISIKHKKMKLTKGKAVHWYGGCIDFDRFCILNFLCRGRSQDGVNRTTRRLLFLYPYLPLPQLPDFILSCVHATPYCCVRTQQTRQCRHFHLVIDLHRPPCQGSPRHSDPVSVLGTRAWPNVSALRELPPPDCCARRSSSTLAPSCPKQGRRPPPC